MPRLLLHLSYSSLRFTIATIVDHMAFLLMPELIKRLKHLAPGLDLEILLPLGSNIELIVQAGTNLSIGAYDILPATFHQRSLYEEDMVCIIPRGYPVIAKGSILQTFVTLSHIIIITGQEKNLVDVALAQRGLIRRIAVRLGCRKLFCVNLRLIQYSFRHPLSN